MVYRNQVSLWMIDPMTGASVDDIHALRRE